MNRWDRLRWVTTWAFRLAAVACMITVSSTLVTVTIASGWFGGILATMPLFGVLLWVKTAFLYLLGSGEAPHCGLKLNQELFQWFVAVFVLFYPLLVCLSFVTAVAAQASRSLKGATVINAIALLLALGIPPLARPAGEKVRIMFPKSASVSRPSTEKVQIEVQEPTRLAYTLALAAGLFQLAALAKPNSPDRPKPCPTTGTCVPPPPPPLLPLPTAAGNSQPS